MSWPRAISGPYFPHCCIQLNPKQHSIIDNISPLEGPIRAVLIVVGQTEINNQIVPTSDSDYLQFDEAFRNAVRMGSTLHLAMSWGLCMPMRW